jgi:transposase
MTTDEELEQLRQEKTALCEALRRKDEELEQAHQANQDLREGLKQAIIAIGSQQERVKVLEGLIDSLQERIKTLERQQAKDSHNSNLPPSSDRFVRARHLLATQERQEGRWTTRTSWASPAAGRGAR